jgi:hypothetical protein
MAFTIIIGIFSLNVATASIVTDGLASYWTFDKVHVVNKTVKDLWGDNNGTIRGNPKLVPGHVGEALEFDGNEDFVNLTTLGDFGRQIGTSTFEAWIKTTNTTDWMPLIYTYGNECPDWGIQLNGLKNGPVLKIRKGMMFFHISIKQDRGCSTFGKGSNFNINDGKWHHIVYITEYMIEEGRGGNGKESIYIDTVFRGLGKTSFGNEGTFVPFTDPVLLGARNFQGKTEGYFEGMIDEVRFYDRPLTADEVIQNFESTTPYNVEPKGKLSTVWGTLKTEF